MSDKAWGEIMDEMDNEAKYAPSSNVAALKARIEALEFEVEHERYNVEKTALEAAKRIKALEAALREIARFPCTNKYRAAQQILLIAKGALEQSK